MNARKSGAGPEGTGSKAPAPRQPDASKLGRTIKHTVTYSTFQFLQT